ncbi:MAG: flagellar filament capping protein FliD, partial [Marmoricola sp.]|nr:flagellar filament capping protein FliD [Marmoricola sp.]
MAGTTSISGLVSGLDTNSIITQLMSIEAQPQTDLKSRLSDHQTQVKALQDLNSKIAALAAQAGDLNNATTWRPLKATSSSTAVAATATTGTAAGSFDITVVATAVAHQLTFASTAKPTDHVTGSTNDVTLTVGGTPRTITSDGTLTGLVNALNAAGTGVKASTITLDDGSKRLIVQAASTGASGAFTLTDAAGNDLLGGASVRQGSDAAITVGADTLHSSTNAFTGQLPGLDLTISAAAVGTTVQVDVAADPDTVQNKVKGLVDSVNAAISSIDALTASDPSTGTAGAFAGDVMLTSLRTSLLNAVYPSDGTSMASMGIQTDRNGKLVFDPDAFTSAYNADPSKVAAAFSSKATPSGTSAVPGFVERLYAVTNRASDSTMGTLTSAIAGQN